MSQIDLDVRGVTKRFSVPAEREADAGAQRRWQRLYARLRPKREFYTAVRDVSFQVRRGEALGIVGHNGAGKSTILKLLSRITAPTEGTITINGRLSALVEVGSGFHPELTGRENVFLSGSILGMRRREIAEKFESIVEFSGVRRFIDTPVKRYSSGMYVRLGFAIAAHLEPDILLLDEVLAVGDAAFQARCIQRVRELEAAGTTIVFISHDLNAVERLCSRAILMERGQVVLDAPTADVVKRYHESLGALPGGTAASTAPAHRVWPSLDEAPGNEVVRVVETRLCAKAGTTVGEIDIREPIGVEITYDVLEPGHVLVPSAHFYNRDGLQVFAVHDVASGWRRTPRPRGRYSSVAWIPGNFLADGPYTVDVAVATHQPITVVHAQARNAVAFLVHDHFGGDAARGDHLGEVPGFVRPLVDWDTRQLAPEQVAESPAQPQGV